MPTSGTTPDSTDEARARSLDATDPLGTFRDRFFVPPGTIYLHGNLLGLLSRDAERCVLDALGSWKEQGING